MTANAAHTLSPAARYGVRETNGIDEFTGDFGAFLATLQGTVELSDPALVKVTRIRLIGASAQHPFHDLSYAFGQLANGDNVRVDLGRDRFGRYSYRRELVACAKAAGRYAKGLGMLDAVSTLED